MFFWVYRWVTPQKQLNQLIVPLPNQEIHLTYMIQTLSVAHPLITLYVSTCFVRHLQKMHVDTRWYGTHKNKRTIIILRKIYQRHEVTNILKSLLTKNPISFFHHKRRTNFGSCVLFYSYQWINVYYRLLHHCNNIRKQFSKWVYSVTQKRAAVS